MTSRTVSAKYTSDKMSDAGAREPSLLLQRARALEPAALTELYDQYAPRLYAYIYRRVHDPHLAEDLTSELFVRVLRAIQVDGAWRKSFNAWIYRAAHNLVVDHFRRRPPHRHLPLNESILAADENPAATVEKRLTHDRLREALLQLTPEQQAVLAMRFGEGLTARQVGQIMHKTTGSVEALQHRGVTALRRILMGD